MHIEEFRDEMLWLIVIPLYLQVSYPQVPNMWIQPTADWKYLGKKIPESSQKQNLELPCTGNYLHSNHIVLGIINILETI